MTGAIILLTATGVGYVLFRRLLSRKARERRRAERRRKQLRDAHRAEAHDEAYRQGWL